MKVRLNEHQEAVAHKAIMEKLWTEPLVGAYLSEFPDVQESTALVAEARCGYIPSQWVHQLGESTRIIALDLCPYAPHIKCAPTDGRADRPLQC